MAEPTISNTPDAGVPHHAATNPTRVTHDRELPVTPLEDESGRGPVHHADGAAPARDPGEAPETRPASESASDSASDSEEELSEDMVKLALRRVKDPELNLNILDLGLVYAIRVEGNDVSIDMTLTSPGCPSGPEIMTDAERHLRALPGVGNVSVNLVWSPFWSPDRIEPRVRAYLGF
jgi:metal-sulfur cluster biosynthetic enzyme